MTKRERAIRAMADKLDLRDATFGIGAALDAAMAIMAEPDEPPEGKLRVRVLVGVAQDGDWYASGRERTRSAEGHTRRNAIDAALGFGAQFRWIEADVTPWTPPAEETVQGREVEHD